MAYVWVGIVLKHCRNSRRNKGFKIEMLPKLTARTGLLVFSSRTTSAIVTGKRRGRLSATRRSWCQSSGYAR